METFPKSNREIVERGKTDTSNTQIYEGSLIWLVIDTSIKSGGISLVV